VFFHYIAQDGSERHMTHAQPDQAPERNHEREERSANQFIDELADVLGGWFGNVDRVGETVNGGAIFGFCLADGTPMSLSVNVTP
jgi:hypothetical protein